MTAINYLCSRIVHIWYMRTRGEGGGGGGMYLHAPRFLAIWLRYGFPVRVWMTDACGMSRTMKQL